MKKEIICTISNLIYPSRVPSRKLLLEHYYYHTSQLLSLGMPYAIQNLLIKYGKKPSIILIICKNIHEIFQSLKNVQIDRKILFYYDEDKIEYFYGYNSACQKGFWKRKLKWS